MENHCFNLNDLILGLVLGLVIYDSSQQHNIYFLLDYKVMQKGISNFMLVLVNFFYRYLLRMIYYYYQVSIRI